METLNAEIEKKYLVLWNWRESIFGSNLHRVKIDKNIEKDLIDLNKEFGKTKVILVRTSQILGKEKWLLRFRNEYCGEEEDDWWEVKQIL